jgi:hypothetical protein
MTHPVRIVFIGCPTLDTAATSHLLLAQNLVQKSIEYSIFHFWIYSDRALKRPAGLLDRLRNRLDVYQNAFSVWLSRKNKAKLEYAAAPLFQRPIDSGSWRKQCSEVLSAYDAWLRQRTHPVHCEGIPTIIITETPITNGYFSLSEQGIGLISTANWSKYFKPVSALDYILSAVQRLSVRLVYSDLLPSHYATKGCFWDYSQHQPDARIAILNGFICSECEQRMKGVMDDDEVDSLRVLVSNKWLGNQSDQYSPSGMLAKIYGYDLSRATGLRAGRLSKVADAFLSELGKMLGLVIKTAVLVLVTLFIVKFDPPTLGSIAEHLRPLLAK